MVPRIIFLLAHRTNGFRGHGSIGRPAAQLGHFLQLGDDWNIRVNQHSIVSLRQHLVREGHDHICRLPGQSLVPVPLTAKLATTVILLAAIAHGKAFLREGHIKRAWHSVGVHCANLRCVRFLDGRSGRHHGSRVALLGRCHHTGEPGRPTWKWHHWLGGKPEPSRGELIAGIAHAGHGRHGWGGCWGGWRPLFGSCSFGFTAWGFGLGFFVVRWLAKQAIRT
mmetsp:Transcript_11096/g.23687  ORF Transcript_11096/g.23687 Transcript_11096/m.23687 type:complete len:223 (+) Transcript_11096:793-1461(+)